MSAALRVAGLRAGWSAVPVVRDADLDVDAGEVVAVFGGNGSGKSTLLWAVAGLLRPTAGTVTSGGRDLTGRRAERIAAAGVRLLPQTRRVFGSMTVQENLQIVDHAVGRPDQAAQRRIRDGWLERFPQLAAHRHRPAALLSGGEQQLVAIGRVVSTGPRVLLLDEPSAGLAPGVAAICMAVFADLAASGVAVVLVEQDVVLAATVATRQMVMREGRPVEQTG